MMRTFVNTVTATSVILAVLFQSTLSSPLVIPDPSIYHAKLRLLQDQSDCRQQLTRPNGTISSPNYPDDYPNNIVCTWEIVAPVGQTIRLTFTDFHLETSPDCSADYVDIYDGKTHQVFCGRERPPVIESVANQMSGVLVTDELINVGNRFSADYVFLGDEGGGEEGLLTAYYYVDLSDAKDVYGFFSSPNHPDAYPKDSLVRYDLLKAENSFLGDLPTRVGFLRMDTEFTPDGRDVVDIYQSDLLLVSLSGSYQFQDENNTAGLPVFQGIDSNVSVVFRSRPDGVAYSGYLFAYASAIPIVLTEKHLTSIQDKHSMNEDLNIQELYQNYRKSSTSRQIIFIDLATQQITADKEPLQKLARFDSKDNDTVTYGYFMSPNHPSNYGGKEDVEYRLLAAEGERIAIYFPRFATEELYDGLILSDGVEEILLMGIDPWDRVYLSNTREVVATFISDGTVNYPGFLAAFASVRITPSTDD